METDRLTERLAQSPLAMDGNWLVAARWANRQTSWCNFRPHYSAVHQWPLSSNNNTGMQSSQTFDLKSLLIAFECSLCCASEHLWKFWYLWKWIDESKQALGVICIHLLGCNGTAVIFYNICIGILVCSRWKPAHLPQCTAISDFLFMCWSLENYRRVLLKVEQRLSFPSIGTQECRCFHSDGFHTKQSQS